MQMIGNTIQLWDVFNTTMTLLVPIVTPTRCTSFSNLFYFEITLYVFWTVFPSIIRSSRLYIQQQVYVIQILLLLTSKQQQYQF